MDNPADRTGIIDAFSFGNLNTPFEHPGLTVLGTLSRSLFCHPTSFTSGKVDTQTEEEIEELIDQARTGNMDALASLFENYRPRLTRMVQVRMDGRLKGRIDPQDVLQEAYIDLAQKLQDYSKRESLSFYVWLRLVTGERLLNIHRRHLKTEKRDVRQELRLDATGAPDVMSKTIAAKLAGEFSSVCQEIIQGELQEKLLTALGKMESTDREVVVLRHFEGLTNKEVAETLSLGKTAASNRYVRAIGRLRDTLKTIPEFGSWFEV